MKKILTIVLAFAMIACMSINTFAAEVPDSKKEGEIPVTASSYSTYEYSIPATIEFTRQTPTPITVTITECDVLESDSLVFFLRKLALDGGITLQHTTKEDVTAKVEFYENQNMQTKLTASHNGISSAGLYVGKTFTLYGILDADAPRGEYSGILYFTLYLNSASE